MRINPSAAYGGGGGEEENKDLNERTLDAEFILDVLLNKHRGAEHRAA